MRSILLAVLAFHWALFLGATAAAELMATPLAVEGGRAAMSLLLAAASSVSATLFMVLGVECVVAQGQRRVPREDVLSFSFAGAVVLLTFETVLRGPVEIGTGLAAPLAALAGSYAVFRLEIAHQRRLEAVNDNKSFGARLMAAGAGRLATMCASPESTGQRPRMEML